MKSKATKKRAPKTRALTVYKRTSNRVRQEAFIAEYVLQYGNKAQAARNLKIPYTTVMNWLRDPKFMERLKMGEEQLFDELHGSLMARAGVSSDILGIFFMKRLKPELFDDKIRQMKHAKEHDLVDPDAAQPITINFVAGEPPERVKKEREEQDS